MRTGRGKEVRAIVSASETSGPNANSFRGRTLVDLCMLALYQLIQHCYAQANADTHD